MSFIFHNNNTLSKIVITILYDDNFFKRQMLFCTDHFNHFVCTCSQKSDTIKVAPTKKNKVRLLFLWFPYLSLSFHFIFYTSFFVFPLFLSLFILSLLFGLFLFPPFPHFIHHAHGRFQYWKETPKQFILRPIKWKASLTK